MILAATTLPFARICRLPYPFGCPASPCRAVCAERVLCSADKMAQAFMLLLQSGSALEACTKRQSFTQRYQNCLFFL